MAETTINNETVLLVPMHLDALVVNRQITAEGGYNRWTMNYDLMNLYKSPMPSPFDDKSEPPKPGVHLHWALPDGLTHGVANEQGDVEFPFVPNRWLVVRIQPGKSQAAAGSIPAWIILSDEVGPQCASSFLDPQKIQPGQVVPTRLGNKRTLEQWDKMMGERGVTPIAPFLRAISPGNVTFAAFAPGVENVFAFHDDLEGQEAASLAYLVLGWYSRPELMDPLFHLPADAWKNKFLFNVGVHFQADLDAGQISAQLRQVFKDYEIPLSEDARLAKVQKGCEWLIAAGDQSYTARLQDGEVFIYDSQVTIADPLNWAVRLEGAPPPTHTIVHGMVYGVDWNPKAELVRPKACPDYKTLHRQVRVAVGNTAVDALAALISNQAENAGAGQVQAELLEAFQYDLLSTLDEPEGKILLDQGIRQAWFGSEPGGTLWTIVAKERADIQPDQKPPALTRVQAEWLAALNRKQRELDAQRRLLASLQWELYALWWKSKVIDHVQPPTSRARQEALRNAKIQIPGHLQTSDSQSLLSRVIALQKAITVLGETVPPTGPDSAEGIAAYARGHIDLNVWELKPAAMPRFWHPTDPVIVISGLGRSEKHGYNGTLLCRLLSQTVGEIIVPYQQKEVRLAAGELKGVIPGLVSQNLPPFINQLLAEAFFLDPGNASIVAEAGLHAAAAQDAVKQAILNIKPRLPDGTNTIGRYGALEWEQPWVPLFLDWQVGFYCAFKQQPDGRYQFDPEHWKFNGTDYVWTGDRRDQLKPAALSYSGRTFLTSQATVPFVDRLQAYINSHPAADPDAARKLLERIAKWDILSQTLSGFTSQLAMRDMQPSVLPEDAFASYVEPYCDSVPYVEIVPDVNVAPGTEPPFFFPLRAGFFSFEKLRIIDSFGRILDLMRANGNPGGKAQGFWPIKGRGMTPDGDGDRWMVKLAPRVVQSSRLSFRYISKMDDRQESGLAADANPVCGWLLPNHLDRSIAVYDAGGNLQGEILLLEKGKGQAVANWQPAPGGRSLTAIISNPHLREMVDALIRRKDQGAGFANLLHVIDKTLWTSDPLGERGDQNLSVLIGRPLALVRANLKLEFIGKPYYNQAWHETFQAGSAVFKENSGGLLDLAVRIRLGSRELRSNGLVGYYQGWDYDHFHAVQLPEGFAPADPPYTHQIGVEDDYVMLKFQPTTAAAFDPTASVYLTMLIDPRGVVQAESGLLPTKTIELPYAYFEEPLKRMAVTFRIGPLLLDAQTVRIPRPAAQRGSWSWIQAASTSPGDWITPSVSDADAMARFTGSSSVLSEGWLKFIPDQSVH